MKLPANRPVRRIVPSIAMAVLVALPACWPATVRAQALAPAAAAATAPPTTVPVAIADRTSPPRPKIGLVLSGGGARGLSHIGVLKVLEELRVPVDYIAATSMGSIVGGLYASGMSAAQLDKLVRGVDWESMFSDTPPRRDLTLRQKEYATQFPLPFQLGLRDGEVQVFRGAIAGANLELWLHDQTRQDDNLGSFDELPIPFRAVATDMVTGQQMVFRHGPLYEAIRASMSVPGLFAPMEIDNHMYGDGGLVNNLPVDVIQALGADIVIAINIGTPLMTKAQLSSLIGVASQSINILTEQNVREQLAKLRAGDVLIEPDLGNLTFLDFTSGPEFIDLGEAAARQATERLRPLGLSPAAYAEYTALRRAPRPPSTPMVAFVQVDGTQRVNPAAITSVVDNTVGKPLNIESLTRDISDLYGTGDFDRIEYRLIDEKNQQGLRFDVVENSIGPNYLRFGVNFSTDLQGESEFNAVAGYKATWLNRWGLQWSTELELGTVRRITTELFQPLGPSSSWFTSLYAEAKREPVYFFDESGKRLAEYSLLSAPIGLDVGYTFSRYGEVRVGVAYNEYRADLAVGAPEYQGGQAREIGAAVFARYDQLDNPYFPRSGAAAELEAFYGPQRVRNVDTTNVSRVRGNALYALPFGPDGAVQFAGRFAISSAVDAAALTDYELGGFLNLSGLKNDQLYGSYLGFARAMYTHRMGDLGIMGHSWYAGASVEIGNTWKTRGDVNLADTRKAGSVFLGLDTYLGPFYVAYGRTSGGDSSWYIFLGRP